MNFSKNSILPLILIISLNTFLVLAYEDKQQSENNGEVKKGKDEADNMMKMQNPPQFPELPPYLEKVLPSDAIQKLKAIHADPSLSFLQKQEKIDKIMTSLPDEARFIKEHALTLVKAPIKQTSKFSDS
ncbi:unnamed protein product [Meloidogyne enterolobii]|uniref:Uncharacterized protein n=1 Tax=Meloidogyne enterolobii TaxID=390850 RepID=A0ACB0ZYD3_MELEN